MKITTIADTITEEAKDIVNTTIQELDTTTKKQILDDIANSNNGTNQKNSMGANEDYYDPYYTIHSLFTKEALDSMSTEELQHLIILGEYLAQIFY